MPLSPANKRQAKHHRTIDCIGYQRDDGLWDIEGHLTDYKTYTFDNQWRGKITPDEPLHEMWLRITLDDTLKIINAEASTEHSPYPECPNFPDNLPKLIGLRIEPGWTRASQKILGGVQGCTHITEILGRVANVAFQTIMPLVHQHMEIELIQKKPQILDTCHALDSHGSVVKREWPQFFVGKKND